MIPPFATIMLYIGLCSQTTKFELLCEEPLRFWEAWSDVALVGNRASAKVSYHQFRSEVRGRPCLHNEAVFYEAIHVQGKSLA